MVEQGTENPCVVGSIPTLATIFLSRTGLGCFVDFAMEIRRASQCRACGRTAPEGAACPWCGERVPLARGSRADLAVAAVALLLLVGTLGLSSMVLPQWLGWIASAVCGVVLSAPPPSARHEGGASGWFVLLSALLALAAARFGTPDSAWLRWVAILPAAAAAFWISDLPPIPAPTLWGRLAQAWLPGLLLSLPLLGFALAWVVFGPSALLAVAGCLLCHVAAPRLPTCDIWRYIFLLVLLPGIPALPVFAAASAIFLLVSPEGRW